MDQSKMYFLFRCRHPSSSCPRAANDHPVHLQQGGIRTTDHVLRRRHDARRRTDGDPEQNGAAPAYHGGAQSPTADAQGASRCSRSPGVNTIKHSRKTLGYFIHIPTAGACVIKLITAVINGHLTVNMCLCCKNWFWRYSTEKWMYFPKKLPWQDFCHDNFFRSYGQMTVGT